MKKTNIVKLAAALLDENITKTLRVVIKDKQIEFFEPNATKPTAVASVVPGHKVVDDNNNTLSDGEYEITPLKVTRIGSVPKDAKAEVETKAAKHQDKTTRSGSPVTTMFDSGM